MQDYKIGMGARIKQRRKELKFTQEAIAEQIGVSVKHFSETERGISGFSVENLINLIKLSDLLHMSLDEMIRGTPADEHAQWELLLEPLTSLPKEKQKDFIELLLLAIKLTK